MVWGNFAWRIVRGEMNLSLDLAGEAIDHAKKLDDPGVWMEALFLMGVTLFYRGDFVGARQQYETALARYDDDHERTRTWAVRVGEHAGVTHRCYLALTLWHLGYAEEALKVNREMLELARSIDHPFSLAYALHHTSWLYQYLRQPKEALAVCDEQIRFAADQGFPLFHATGIVYEAGGSLLQGQALQALPGLIRGLDAYRATGAALALPFYFGLVGSALIELGPSGRRRHYAEQGAVQSRRRAMIVAMRLSCSGSRESLHCPTAGARRRRRLTSNGRSRSRNSSKAELGSCAPRPASRASTRDKGAMQTLATGFRRPCKVHSRIRHARSSGRQLSARRAWQCVGATSPDLAVIWDQSWRP